MACPTAELRSEIAALLDQASTDSIEGLVALLAKAARYMPLPPALTKLLRELSEKRSDVAANDSEEADEKSSEQNRQAALKMTQTWMPLVLEQLAYLRDTPDALHTIALRAASSSTPQPSSSPSAPGVTPASASASSPAPETSASTSAVSTRAPQRDDDKSPWTYTPQPEPYSAWFMDQLTTHFPDQLQALYEDVVGNKTEMAALIAGLQNLSRAFPDSDAFQII
ncbi:hypothetical protein CXG81DRAFT_27529 [Caulochytrium protostelioides]|uniref:Uncharacterized protein n=1 Tax=Caulochytrium protostelioides TaxID=1555241 RepID=A0A4P9WXY0_9FUNG|nr:hypothetical protein CAUPRSCDRAFT_11969 [Caulochytrium protostelioides]RKO99734.1 hypothetical protein CXG81DRAFT_27529 [Caulochytrium protostelioides]|eukprot:RKO99734.1 hypothetical protein CXG81DRAFT_27529 [Caulochytrium protostelioides]